MTSHVEDDRATVTGLGSGESVVIMAKSYHQGNQTESDYVNCIESSLRSGSKGINVVPRQQFVDRLFPWFEPRTVPADTKGLPGLMERPGVKQAIADMGVRYVVWLDGDTERVAEGGAVRSEAQIQGTARFKVEDLPSGTWTLTVTRKKDGKAYRGTAVVSTGDAVDIELQPE